MIDQALRAQGSMLAEPSKKVDPDLEAAVRKLASDRSNVFDLKWDGIRSFAFVDRGSVQLVNRRGVDITFRYPEVISSLALMYDNTTIVLDGEIICIGNDGKPDFARVHIRDAQQGSKKVAALMREYPATYVAFDVIGMAGDDLRKQPYAVRRALLMTESKRWEGDDHLMPTITGDDGLVMWDMIREQGLEGLIVKRSTTPYRAGRSMAWVKLKPMKSVSALVSGVDPGKGWRADTFGALHLALLGADSKLVQIGKVGTGFDTQSLALVKERLESGVPLVIEVAYQQVSKDMILRLPVFKGIRDDVLFTDCTLDQIKPKDWTG